jgi:energy-converting hydrogenase Eha subunit C
LLLFLAVVLQGIFAIHRIGISWDEPFYYRTARGYAAWAGEAGRSGAFSAERLEQTFGLRPLKNDHPTLARIVGALTLTALRGPLGEFWAYRFSAPLLLGVLVAALYLHVARAGGRTAAFAAVLLLVTMPRFYTDSHIAATDAALSVFWFLAAVTFERACEGRGPWWLPGVAFGLCMSVKFTGFLVPVPLLAWGLAYRRRDLLRPALGLLLGPFVFLLLQPAMWHQPLAGIADFVRLSVTRESWNPHWVLFLGRVYDFSGPWYYAPFLVLATVPEITLLLSLAGAARALRNRLRDAWAGSSLIHFGFFMLLTMAPAAPLFDGVRLFLPAFVFLGILAGYGFEGLTGELGARAAGWRDRYPQRFRALRALPVALLVILAPLPLARIYPYGLEYYNRLVGGVRGAHAAGLETTYWWTVLTEEHLARINQLLPRDARLRFVPMDPDLHELYRELGLLRADIRVVEGGEFDYALVLSRPSWKFPRLFAMLGVSPERLRVAGSLTRDGVPFWVLYRREQGQ